jgi:arsenate reductase-like glutaredoxin family protein
MEPEDAEFIDYLKNTLVPDLIENGMTETAKDFETMIRMAEKYAGVASA